MCVVMESFATSSNNGHVLEEGGDTEGSRKGFLLRLSKTVKRDILRNIIKIVRGRNSPSLCGGIGG